METVIGVFDQQYAETALRRLFDNGFTKEELWLVDRERILAAPTMQTFGGTPVVPPANTGSTSSTPVVPPIGIVNPVVNSGNASQPTVVPPAFDAEFLGISGADSNEAFEFYRRAVERGATLIMVRTSPERAAMARRIMHNSHASNVNEAPQDKQARV